MRFSTSAHRPTRCFPPLQVVLATFLGTPLGGSVALAWNYAVLQRTASAMIVTSAGFWGTVAVCVAFALSADPGVRLAAIVIPVGVATIAAQVLQAGVCRAHEQQGGQTAPYWRAAALGGACGALLLGSYLAYSSTPLGKLAYSFLGVNEPKEKLNFGPHEDVYYSDGATEEDARRLGQFLQKIEYLSGKGAASARISRRGETLLIGFAVRDGTWDDARAVRAFASIGERVRRDAFPGQPVEIQLLDEHLNVRKTID
jgi:hypothetical protein